MLFEKKKTVQIGWKALSMDKSSKLKKLSQKLFNRSWENVFTKTTAQVFNFKNLQFYFSPVYHQASALLSLLRHQQMFFFYGFQFSTVHVFHQQNVCILGQFRIAKVSFISFIPLYLFYILHGNVFSYCFCISKMMGFLGKICGRNLASFNETKIFHFSTSPSWKFI